MLFLLNKLLLKKKRKKKRKKKIKFKINKYLFIYFKSNFLFWKKKQWLFLYKKENRYYNKPVLYIKKNSNFFLIYKITSYFFMNIILNLYAIFFNNIRPLNLSFKIKQLAKKYR